MSFNILVAYDGSDLSRKAVEEAKKQVELAEKAVLHVVTVISNGGPTVNVALARSFMNDLAEEARPAIESFREELEETGIKCKTDILMDYTFRNPASQLIDYAKENEVELIVLGSRGLGGVGRFFLGSVSSQIVHQAQCKVLVVK
ncbi:universal stress protein [Oceanobacillus neutriphilus]|uniref:Universal stress protein UspA n=1 Tax=Oceanobacillus neutriphilus TaxID=531815 RepID=A0ABQ2P0L4_9BACI|nr:universal stress protein [Oceanobacillus neutriphilus]GGP14927.1 universal stress protein UspA [Oceanobacillus neutriphilus]